MLCDEIAAVEGLLATSSPVGPPELIAPDFPPPMECLRCVHDLKVEIKASACSAAGAEGLRCDGGLCASPMYRQEEGEPFEIDCASGRQDDATSDDSPECTLQPSDDTGGNLPLERRPKRTSSILTEQELQVRARAESVARRKSDLWQDKLELDGQDSSESPLSFVRCLRHQYFEGFFGAMIFLNCLVLAGEVQYQSKHIGEPQLWAFAVAGYVFNVLFLLELLCRIAVDGLWDFFTAPGNRLWALLDTFVVLVATIESVQNIVTGGQLEDASNLAIMRAMRIVRLFRSFRIFRLARVMTPLRALVISILATLRSLFWAAILLGFAVYVFGVMFTDCAVTGHATVEDEETKDTLFYYWGSLDRSMSTLYQAVANGISWRAAYECISEVSIICGWLFMGSITFMYFVLLNVFTGVFCTAAMESAHKDPEVIARSAVERGKANMQCLTNLFRKADVESSGHVTILEFEALLEDEMCRAQFQACGIDVHDAWEIFKLLDANKDGKISEFEFVSGISGLQGGAKNADMAATRLEARFANRLVIEHLRKLEGMIAGGEACGYQSSLGSDAGPRKLNEGPHAAPARSNSV